MHYCAPLGSFENRNLLSEIGNQIRVFSVYIYNSRIELLGSGVENCLLPHYINSLHFFTKGTKKHLMKF